MYPAQKETALSLLRFAENNRAYGNNYMIPYKDFLDPTDDFTDLNCERLEGKQDYIDLLDQLFQADESAYIYVCLYGFEEDHDDIAIYSDTLIVFSRLPLAEVQQIFNSAEDIFPSDVGEITDFNETYFVIDETGKKCQAADYVKQHHLASNHSIYYCWWD